MSPDSVIALASEPTVPTKKRNSSAADIKASIESLKKAMKHDSLFIKRAIVTINDNVSKSRADLAERLQELHDKYTSVKEALDQHGGEIVEIKQRLSTLEAREPKADV
jgi:predicted nuclease with TOPRIM domain